MKKNRLRELLKAGKPTLGTHMISVSPQNVEIIGHSGAFDYIELVGEYASWGLADLDNFARTVELFPDMSSMIKVEQEPRTFITFRSLGAGIQNVLFANCYSAAEVRECIRAVRPATPEDGGIHSGAVRRSGGYFIDVGNEAWVEAQREVVIAVMIEKVSAMEQLEEILSIEGVDMVQFGPTDYSLNLGKPGQEGIPEVQGKQREMIELALKKGVHPRAEIDNLEQAEEYINMGVRHFCIGTDLYILYQWCQENGSKMRERLAGI
jgi:2-keto-3-deoxy-L-rhamnonate aldolase RhmA